MSGPGPWVYDVEDPGGQKVFVAGGLQDQSQKPGAVTKLLIPRMTFVMSFKLKFYLVSPLKHTDAQPNAICQCKVEINKVNKLSGASDGLPHCTPTALLVSILHPVNFVTISPKM